jgi:hypothetical protein
MSAAIQIVVWLIILGVLIWLFVRKGKAIMKG